MYINPLCPECNSKDIHYWPTPEIGINRFLMECGNCGHPIDVITKDVIQTPIANEN